MALGVLATSCQQPSDGSGPELIDGRWLDVDPLELTFADGLGEITGVDPNKFRLTSSGYYLDGTGTWYADLGYYDVPPHRAEITQLSIDPDDQAKLLLELGGSTESACERISDWLADARYADVAFYATFTPLGEPTVVDNSGYPLGAIAAHWVAREELYAVVESRFRSMTPRIPIACPE